MYWIILELQNTHKDLIFSIDSMERINACLNELTNTGIHLEIIRMGTWSGREEERITLFTCLIVILFCLLCLGWRYLDMIIIIKIIIDGLNNWQNKLMN